jgi:hypothetical protein
VQHASYSLYMIAIKQRCFEPEIPAALDCNGREKDLVLLVFENRCSLVVYEFACSEDGGGNDCLRTVMSVLLCLACSEEVLTYGPGKTFSEVMGVRCSYIIRRRSLGRSRNRKGSAGTAVGTSSGIAAGTVSRTAAGTTSGMAAECMFCDIFVV